MRGTTGRGCAPRLNIFDPAGEVISINSAGNTSMTAEEAAGTTYDGATPLLTAATPVTAGAHSLYLSIFDQGDRVYDSTNDGGPGSDQCVNPSPGDNCSP